LKVLIVSFEYPPNISGGIGSFNYELSKGLARKGIEVVVVAGGDKDYLFMDKNLNLKVYFLSYPKVRPHEFYFQLYNAKRIAKIVEREKPDVIQLNSGWNFFLKVLKDKCSKYAIVQVLHGSPGSFSRAYEDLKHLFVTDIVQTIALNVYDKISHFELGHIIRECVDAYVHVSKHVLYYNLKYAGLKEVAKDKVNVVIYPCLDIEQLRKIRRNVVDREKRLIFGARLVPYKGLTYLIKAFELAHREDKELRLDIFGDGPQRSMLLRQIKRLRRKGVYNIHYHGKVPRNIFLEELARGHVLVHPSFYESVGLVMIEAALLGTPVIAHRAPYSEEFVESLMIGRTVDVRNIEEFADVILSTVSDADLRLKVAERFQTLSSLFSTDVCVEKYVELYHRIMKQLRVSLND